MNRYLRTGLLSLCMLVLAGSFVMPTPGYGVAPDEVLADAALEARARALSAGLRCVVCQNQSIDDSEAPLAKDLRLLVRERLQAGESDRQVVDYIVARYGEFVLLRPRFSLHTLLLWLSPPIIFLLAIAGLYRAHRNRRDVAAPQTAAVSLSAGEQERLAELLKADAGPERI